MGLLDWWQRRNDPPAWDESAHRSVIAALPGTQGLPEARLQQWGSLARWVLADKQFLAPGGAAIELAQAVTIATLASWPMLNLGRQALAGWREIVLYPSGFRARRRLLEAQPEGLDLVHEYDEELAGEAGEGVIVLAWEDILEDLAHPQDGACVVIHEVAHQFDACSGVIDGRPPLPGHMDGREWSEIFQREFDRLCSRLQAGEESWVDPYAAEAPEEFFAVMVEHYCLRPDWLQQDCPQVARLLRGLFGPIRADAPT